MEDSYISPARLQLGQFRIRSQTEYEVKMKNMQWKALQTKKATDDFDDLFDSDSEDYQQILWGDFLLSNSGASLEIDQTEESDGWIYFKLSYGDWCDQLYSQTNYSTLYGTLKEIQYNRQYYEKMKKQFQAEINKLEEENRELRQQNKQYQEQIERQSSNTGSWSSNEEVIISILKSIQDSQTGQTQMMKVHQNQILQVLNSEDKERVPDVGESKENQGDEYKMLMQLIKELDEEIAQMPDSNRIRNIRIEESSEKRVLNKGQDNFVGEVKLLEIKDDRDHVQLYAVKRFPGQKLICGMMELLNHARIPKYHPNLIPLRGFTLEMNEQTGSYSEQAQTINQISLYFDFSGDMNLESFVKGEDFKQLHQQITKQLLILEIMQGLCKAVYLLHSVSIIHNDIKPSNVMVEYDKDQKKLKRVYLIDLGAGVINESVIIKKSEPTIYLQTESYSAPEALRGKKLDKKSDVWSLGCLLYFLATEENGPRQGSSEVQNQKYFEKISWVRELLNSSLEPQLDKRISLGKFLLRVSELRESLLSEIKNQTRIVPLQKRQFR